MKGENESTQVFLKNVIWLHTLSLKKVKIANIY